MKLNVITFEKNGNVYANDKTYVTMNNVRSFGFAAPNNLMATLTDGASVEIRNVKYFDCFDWERNA